MIKKTAFICGCGHSGTTLLATILSEHEDVHVPLFETNAFLKGNPSRWILLKRIRLGALLNGKRVLIEKTPAHIHKIDEMRSAMRGCRFILMVRDGRDVAVSIAQRQGGNFDAGVRRWIRDNNALAKQLKRPDVFLVRYEDLVQAPADTVRHVCEFIGISFDPKMLDFHKTPRRWFNRRLVGNAKLTEHHERRNRQINQPIFDGRGRWQTSLPTDMISIFTHGRAASLMRMFNYIN